MSTLSAAAADAWQHGAAKAANQHHSKTRILYMPFIDRPGWNIQTLDGDVV
jgi:hypothetical protein